MKFIPIFLSIITLSFTSIKAQDSLSNKSAPIELKTTTGTIYGTLVIPIHVKGKMPVALIIAGSGPTDRDGNNSMMKNNSLKQLAESLAANGIATLRYDKRGVAESKLAGKSEADLRFEDYINDANDWIKLLKEQKVYSKVIVIGHSEGSLIGMNAAKNAEGFVSIAGAGYSADLILKNQLVAQGKQIQDMCFPILDSLKEGKLVANVNPMLNSLFRSSVQPYMISWFKHNPQADIKQLKYPSLILQGDNDLQISIDDARQLSAASPKSKLVIIEKMNHILKIVDSGDKSVNVAAYSNPALPIATRLVNEIVKYIKK